MSIFTNLSPKLLWDIFEEITSVPRPSKKEGKIRKWLTDFAGKHSLAYKTDAIGNVVIVREASAGMEDRPVVILQSHMDMVCEKNSDVNIDFDNDPIRPYVTEDGWVKAHGTTLGADDGIGMAAALAVLVDPSINVPAIEALFTVDEETGLTGAFNLGENMITGKYLINLDSEDEGELFIGCAGGVDTLATFEMETEPKPENHIFWKVSVSGLKGGHSGDDINKGLGNSNKILARFLLKATEEFRIRLCTIEGGNLRNAIPREANAIFCVPVEAAKGMICLFERYAADAKEEFKHTDAGLDITIAEAEPCPTVMSEPFQCRLLGALQGVPNGVLAMSAAMPGLVETSTNLASVKMKGNTIVVTTSQRSSVDSARMDAAASVGSVFRLAGAKVEHSDGYPGWNPDPTSKLLEVCRESYTALFGVEPIVRAIHAGLECGLFLQKYPHLEMVSFGPTLRGVHSPDERLEISTVDKFWKHLIDTLQKIR